MFNRKCSDIWRKNKHEWGKVEKLYYCVQIIIIKTYYLQKKVRTGKISKGQKQKLLEILRGHRNVAMGQFGRPNSGKSAQAVWETVAAELNACGPACKTSDQWNKSYSYSVFHVRAYFMQQCYCCIFFKSKKLFKSRFREVKRVGWIP